MSAAPPPQADAMRLSWPAFSSRVMRAISWSTKAGTSRLPAACRSARAGLASHAATAPAPMSAARREMRVSNMNFPSTVGRPSARPAASAANFFAALDASCNRLHEPARAAIAIQAPRGVTFAPFLPIRRSERPGGACPKRRSVMWLAELRFRSRPSRARSMASIMSASRRVTRVADAVRELGYVPHAGARSLSLARTNAIGVVLPDLHGEFFSEIVRGMDREASSRGYLLLLSNMHGRKEQAVTALHAMRGRVDGLIVMAPHLSEAELAAGAPCASSGGADQYARRREWADRRSISTMPRAPRRLSNI